ncbi:MAG: redoxin domain-containing protein [Candidatus Kapabacteria bacterium]|nr:redoxin domain-containing protein [Candidatus Kapabacteria bacterium]
MKYLKNFVVLILIFLGIQTVRADEILASVDKIAPDFTLFDHKGKKVKLSDFKGKYVVLEWINFDCPFVKKHYDSKNMQTIQQTYKNLDVVWLSICSSAPGKQGHFKADEIEDRIKKNEAKMSYYLIDEDGKVGKMYGAKTTPHMFIVDPNQNLIYAGGIDDIASSKQEDIEKANNYVVEVLTAAMNNQPIKNKTTKPYGCSVKY